MSSSMSPWDPTNDSGHDSLPSLESSPRLSATPQPSSSPLPSPSPPPPPPPGGEETTKLHHNTSSSASSNGLKGPHHPHSMADPIYATVNQSVKSHMESKNDYNMNMLIQNNNQNNYNNHHYSNNPNNRSNTDSKLEENSHQQTPSRQSNSSLIKHPVKSRRSYAESMKDEDTNCPPPNLAPISGVPNFTNNGEIVRPIAFRPMPVSNASTPTCGPIANFTDQPPYDKVIKQSRRNGESLTGQPLIKDGGRQYGSSQDLHRPTPQPNYNKFSSLDRRAVARRHQTGGLNFGPAVSTTLHPVSKSSAPERRHSSYNPASSLHRTPSQNSEYNRYKRTRENINSIHVNGLPDPFGGNFVGGVGHQSPDKHRPQSVRSIESARNRSSGCGTPQALNGAPQTPQSMNGPPIMGGPQYPKPGMQGGMQTPNGGMTTHRKMPTPLMNGNSGAGTPLHNGATTPLQNGFNGHQNCTAAASGGSLMGQNGVNCSHVNGVGSTSMIYTRNSQGSLNNLNAAPPGVPPQGYHIHTQQHQQQQHNQQQLIQQRHKNGHKTDLEMGYDGSDEDYLTPSPSDSAVADLEIVLKEKDSEINFLRETMEQNEQVYEEKERMWEREVRKIKSLYENRIKANQQKASKMEAALLNQTYQLQNEKSRLESEIREFNEERDKQQKVNIKLQEDILALKTTASSESNTKNKEKVDNETERSDCENNSEKLVEDLRQKIRELTNTNSVLSAENQRLRSLVDLAGEDVSLEELAHQKEIIIARNRDIEVLESNLSTMKLQADQLKVQLDREREDWDRETNNWLQEKEKVIRYQKQLQLNYVSMYKRNKLLETELEDLKKTAAALPTSHTSSSKSAQQSAAASEKNNNHSSSKSGIFDMSSSLTLSSGGKKSEGSNGGGGLGSALSGSTSSIQKPLGHVSSAKAKLLSKFSSKFNDN